MAYYETSMTENPAYAASKILNSSQSYEELKTIGEKKSVVQENLSKTDAANNPNKFSLKNKIIDNCMIYWKYLQPVLMVILILDYFCLIITIASVTSKTSEEHSSTALKLEQLFQNQSNILAIEELLDRYYKELTIIESRYANLTCAKVWATNESSYTNNICIRNIISVDALCQPVKSSWIRVIELDMSDPSSLCPMNFTITNISSEFRTCTPVRTSPGCTSVFFSAQNMTYSKVFGKIKAYQYGNTNSFSPYKRGSRTIDDPYVDGVSLTYGQPRQHIWTFAADGANTIDSFCPCSGKANIDIPEYIGEDYFCDTGEATNTTFAVDNPLWDGKGCVTNYTCCTFNNPPWFYKQLPTPTSEPIELRVCTDQFTSSENLALEAVHIYGL